MYARLAAGLAMVLCLGPMRGLAQAAPARWSRLEGQVVDTTGRPIAFATIDVAGARTGAVSDSVGKFQILHLSSGATQFRVRRLGYFPGDFDVVLPAESALIVTIHLTAVPILIDSLVGNAPRRDLGLDAVGFSQRMLERKMGGGSSTFITEQDIERRHPDQPSDMLITVPGVRLTYERNTAVPRGRGGCLINVWVDGHYMNPYLYPSNASGAGGTFAQGSRATTVPPGQGLDALIGPHEIAGMEIYPNASEVPFRFQVDAGGCGAIVIWTK